MKIAVIGATSGVGLALVQAALADGHEVTALVRPSSRMPLFHARLRTVEGDAEDFQAIAKVVEGQQAICVCLGTANVVKRITMFSRCAEHLSKTMNADQLLIALTGIGTGDSKGHGTWLYDHVFLPIVLRRMYADKDRQEDIIKRHIARWIIVRCGFLNNGPRTGNYRALAELHGNNGGMISRADVADFMLAQAKSPQFIGQTPLLIS